MSSIKILLVEDNAQDIETCQNSANVYYDKENIKINLIVCENVEDSIANLDNSFDGAIIDLKLAENDGEGNDVIRTISDSNFRIPVAIFTGTPDSATTDFSYIGVFKKGETGYNELFDKFLDVYNTGLTRIMGSRGIIEESLGKVFKDSIITHINSWIEYGKIDPPKTEKALLRYTLNHLLQLLDDDIDSFFPEEVYLNPFSPEKIQTGRLLRGKSENINSWFIVLTPACDLVARKTGKFKTDRILLVEIEKTSDVTSAATDGITRLEKKKKKLGELLSNNHTDYYHFLPELRNCNENSFTGGFINFRKLSSITPENLDSDFFLCKQQVSPAFVKDILSRFSSYYARQGQPDIDLVSIIDKLSASPEPESVT